MFYCLVYYKDTTIQDFLIKLYSDRIEFHLWYLYAYMAYLISVPLLRAMVQNLDNKLLVYMIIAGLFFVGILPVLEWVFGRNTVQMNSNLTVDWLASSIILPPVAGFLLEQKLSRDKLKKLLPFVWVCSVILVGVCGYLTYVRSVETGVLSESKSQAFFNLFSVVYAATAFITVKVLFTKRTMPVWLAKMISAVGKSTFGVFLLHVFVMNIDWMIRFRNFLITALHPMLGIHLYCLVSLILSSALTVVLSRIPVIRKVLGY